MVTCKMSYEKQERKKEKRRQKTRDFVSQLVNISLFCERLNGSIFIELGVEREVGSERDLHIKTASDQTEVND